MTGPTLRLPPFTDQEVILRALSNGATIQIDLSMTNDLGEAGSLIERHCVELMEMGLFTSAETSSIRLALEEAVSNAILHGNLEIDKTLREQDYVAWMEQVNARQNEQPYYDRRVTVAIRLNTEQIEYEITDEGRGFDAGQLPQPAEAPPVTTCGGRGLMLMRSAMDHVSHNNRGNCLTMRKRFGQPLRRMA